MRSVCVVAMLLGLSAPAQAQPSPVPRESLTVNWVLDGAIVLSTGSGWIVTEATKGHLAPDVCRWCSQNVPDREVANALSWSQTGTAAKLSDLAAFGILPVLTLGGTLIATAAEKRLRDAPTDLMLVLEAATVTMAANQIVKLAAGRERPFVAELPPDAKSRAANPSDNNLSFYSGHTTLAFALVVSAATVAHLRESKVEPYLWAVGLPIATLVAYGRIAANKHYLSDVLVGGFTGAAVGFLVPYLHRTQRTTSTSDLAVAPALNGLALSGTF